MEVDDGLAGCQKSIQKPLESASILWKSSFKFTVLISELILNWNKNPTA